MNRYENNNYWNHNVAYHEWIIKQIYSDCINIIDVGCGEGLLLKKLLPYSKNVVGIDPDSVAIRFAAKRLTGEHKVELICDDFITYRDFQNKFDYIIFVASIHHMDTEAALKKAKSLLCPSGKIFIVGCSKPKSAIDWFLEIIRAPLSKTLSLINREYNPSVAVLEPKLSQSEVTANARKNFKKVSVRTGLFYRYLMVCQV